MSSKSLIAIGVAAGLALALAGMGHWYEPTSAARRKELAKLVAIQTVVDKSKPLRDFADRAGIAGDSAAAKTATRFPECCNATYFIGGLSSNRPKDYLFADRINFRIKSFLGYEPYYVTVYVKVNGNNVGATMIVYGNGEIYGYSPL